MVNRKKKIIVCDYPNPKNYTFPSFGFGSSEKRVWQLAKSFSEMSDFETIIAGPLWLPQYVPNAVHFKKRLDETTVDDFLKRFGMVDYLFAGHEYFGNPLYDNAFLKIADILMSYVFHPHTFPGVVFDAKRKHLFCYSDEIKEMYKEQKPHKLLLFHGGVGEEPYFSNKHKDYLVWIGRLDFDKAPHYAILAAQLLDMPLYLLGKSVYQPEYEDQYKKVFEYSKLRRMGVVFGKEKMKLLSEAACGVYTCLPTYVEAGAGVLGEMLRSGIPIAGITWKGNDAVCEAVDDPSLGNIVKLNAGESDKSVAGKLARAISICLKLDKERIFHVATEKYDSNKLARKMIETVDRSR